MKALKKKSHTQNRLANMQRRASKIDENFEKFAGAVRNQFEGFAKMIATPKDQKLISHGQYLHMSKLIRALEPSDFHKLLQVLDRYEVPYFHPTAPVETLKELPLACTRELLACLEHGLFIEDRMNNSTSEHEASEVCQTDSEEHSPKPATSSNNSKEFVSQSRFKGIRNLFAPVALGSSLPMKKNTNDTIEKCTHEIAALQRILEEKMRNNNDLKQQLASALVRAQNAESDMNFYKKRVETCNNENTKLVQSMQKLHSAACTLELERTALKTLLEAAEAKIKSAESVIDTQKMQLHKPPKLAITDIKEMIAIANNENHQAVISNESNKIKTSIITKAKVDSLHYMQGWLMDSIRQNEEIRTTNELLQSEIESMQSVITKNESHLGDMKSEYDSACSAVKNLGQENEDLKNEMKKLQLEIENRDKAQARMESMYVHLKEANEQYAVEQINFRNTITSQFNEAIKLKEEAIKQQQQAEDKV